MKERRNKKSGKKQRHSHIREIYDAFPIKDMTFKEFEGAYNKATSPVTMRNELKELIRYRSHQRTQRLVAVQSKKQLDARLWED